MFARALPPCIALFALASTSLFAPVAAGAPFRPATDEQVLERLPARAGDPRMRELASLRSALARQPHDAEQAVRLVQRYLDEVAADGDPRYVGHAQAALAPWWTLPDPPADVRVMRAVLRQFNHEFDAALADLQAVVQAHPDHATAWAWIAAVQMVQARYVEARQACQRMQAIGPTLGGQACVAAADAASGRAGAAVAALQAALQASASPAERLWALTRLAEIQDRLGDDAAAERSFREALGLGVRDIYLLAAYADFLLDRGRAADVLALLGTDGRADVLLLRLALAAKAAGDASLPRHRDALAARFEAARRRGDTSHRKEEARFALHVLGDAARALPLARANFEQQREPADARLLLEAALAAGEPAAAQPALQWWRQSGIEGALLQRLAGQLGATR